MLSSTWLGRSVNDTSAVVSAFSSGDCSMQQVKCRNSSTVQQQHTSTVNADRSVSVAPYREVLPLTCNAFRVLKCLSVGSFHYKP
jgi:hypothetical protein